MTVFVVLLSLIVSAGAANYGYSNDNVDNNPEGISTGSEPDNAATRGGEARYKPTISDTRVEYVIITASTFEDELAPLAEWKTRKGVAAKIYTLEDIYNDYTGVDKAQQVHNFLRDIDSKSNHLQWVLLAGDADADQNANDPPLPFVPSRYLYSHGATYGQSDYYWGDVYFAGLSHDWNQDSDDKWGEIDSNHFSLQGTGTSGEESDKDYEAYVGRLPGDTSAQMTNMVNKILTYEKSPPSGNWMQTAVLWGGLMDAPNDGLGDPEDENAYWVKNKRVKPIIPSHMTIKEFYDYWDLVDGGYSLGQDNLNRANAVASLNDGASFINFAGQAYYEGWALIDYKDATGMGTIDDWWAWQPLYWWYDGVNATNGDKLPFVYMSGCDAAVFNYTYPKRDRSQEQLLFAENGGAIGLISSTSHTYRGVEGDKNQGNWWLDENFWKLMFQNGYYQPGKALYELKEMYTDLEESEAGNQISAVRSNQFGYLLLGDPEINIWTYEPRTMNVEAEDLFVGQGEAKITVKDSFSGNPIEGALVNIMNIELYEQSYTNETGVATIPINPFTEQGVEIIVTAHNYLPKEVLTEEITEKPYDLKVEAADMSLDITEPLDGDNVRVIAKIHNLGGLPLEVPATIRFYEGDPAAGGSQIGTDQYVNNIVVDSFETASVNWQAVYDPEAYDLYVQIDPDNTLGEYTRDNNKAYISTSVLGSDLWISSTDISFEPSSLISEYSVQTVNITINNIGKVDARNIYVGLFEGHPFTSGYQFTPDEGQLKVPVIFKQSFTYITATFSRPAGIHDIHVFVDVDNSTFEENEGNNIASAQLVVNHAPRIRNLDDVIIDEDTVRLKALDLHNIKFVSDQDNTTDELDFKVMSVDPPGNLTVKITDGRYVEIHPADNWTGKAEITIEVSDGLSTNSDSFNVTIREADDRPVAEPIEKISKKANEEISLTVSVFDADGDALFFSDDSDLFEVDYYEGTINFTTNDTMVGTHTVTITVTDGELSTTVTFTIEILPRDNRPPVLDQIDDIKATVGEPYRLILKATDPDGDRLTFSVDPPLFFTISSLGDTSSEISFTPNEKDVVANQELLIWVSDGLETDEQKITLTIVKKDKDNDDPMAVNPIWLGLIAAIIMAVIIILLFFRRRQALGDRDMKAWESMSGKATDEDVEKLTDMPIDRPEGELSLIEQEIFDSQQKAELEQPKDAYIESVGSEPEAPVEEPEAEGMKRDSSNSFLGPESSSESMQGPFSAREPASGELPPPPPAALEETAPLKKKVKKKKKKKAAE